MIHYSFSTVYALPRHRIIPNRVYCLMFPTAQPVPQTMRALIFDPNGPGKMAWKSNHPVAKPGNNQVLIKVESASLNPLDFRTSDTHSLFISNKGHVVGRDVAGTVMAVGKNVNTLSVGAQVFGLGPGLAQYTVTEASKLVRVPQGKEPSDMAPYGLVGTVAHQILCKHWFDRPNYVVRSLLVIGASGGIGSSITQIARALGGPEVTVYGVTSEKHPDVLREIGISQAIDYSVPGFDLSKVLPLHSMDLIVDTVSGAPENPNYIESGILLLKPSGRYVSLNSMKSLDWFKSYISDACGCNMQRSRFDLFIADLKKPGRNLDAISRLVSQGRYKLAISDVLPLSETPIRRALHSLKQRHVKGKVKILPQSNV